MNFLREAKQNITPKPISKRRLSELERHNREIEELSSFFLPTEKTSVIQRPEMLRQPLGAPVTSLPSERFSDGDEVRTRSESLCEEDSRSLSVHSHADRGGRSVTFNRSERRPGSAATYYTWSSSSVRSPKRQKTQRTSVSPVLKRQESANPDAVDELMIATGIFRNTNIYNFDHVPGHSQNDQQLNLPRGRSGQERTRVESTQIKGPEVKTKHLDSHGDSDIVPASLKARLDAIFPPAWREPDVDANSRPREDTDEHNKGAGLLSHTQPENSASMTEMASARSHDTQSSSARLEESQFPAPLDASVGQIDGSQVHAHDDSLPRTESRTSQSDERLSTTSRDLMPPPPRPSDCLSRRTTLMQMNKTEADFLPEDISSARANPPFPRHEMTRLITRSPPAAVSRGAQKLPHARTRLPSEWAYNFHELNKPNSKEFIRTPATTSSWLSQAYTSMTSDAVHMRNTSEVSMHSASHVDSVEAGEDLSVTENPAFMSELGESLADYIARIEREVYQDPLADVSCPSSLKDKDIQPLERIPPRFQIDYTDVNHQAREFHVKTAESSGLPSQGVPYGSAPSQVTLDDVSGEHQDGAHRYELNLDDEVGQSDVLEEERNEMSGFWRPNQLFGL